MIHQLNPIAIDFGWLQIHWYGISYLVAFLGGLGLGIRRAHTQPWRGWSTQEVWDLLTYAIIGTLLGGRIGYVIFYQWSEFTSNPMLLFNITSGGMSFHGGFIGVALALILFARHKHKTYWQVTDFVAPLAPLGIASGRLGNFINGELWGRPTEASWGMVFPQAGDALSRHPSQLYQAAGEGLLLFLLLWWFSHRPRPRLAVTGAFLLGYGLLRTWGEFFREPDRHIGYLVAENLTLGMLLSAPLWLLGILMIGFAWYCPPVDFKPLPANAKKAQLQNNQKKRNK